MITGLGVGARNNDFNSKQLERLEQTVEEVGKSCQTGYQSAPAKDSVPKDTKGN